MKKKAKSDENVDIVADDESVELISDAAPETAPPTGPEDQSAEDTAPVERDFEMELEQKAIEYEELRDRHLRLVAEFDNFRKRTVREKGEAGVRAQAQLLSRLIDALDDLGRVSDLDPEQTAASDVVAGVELVERNIFKQLEAIGLEVIGTPGDTFDPNHHEAIGTVPSENEDDENTVAAVLQTGYRIGPVLLRPARVQVFM